MSRPRLPESQARLLLLAAGGTWAGVVAGWQGGATRLGLPLLSLAAWWAWATRRALVVMVLLALLGGLLSATLASAREQALLELAPPPGRFQAQVTALSDTRTGPYGASLRVLAAGVPLLVTGEVPPVAVGDRLRVDGWLGGEGRRVRGEPVAATVTARSVIPAGPPRNPALRVANEMRERVLDRIDPSRNPRRALLAGFLVGETGSLPATDEDALRRAGLSHFVAVSGSNVGLFLLLWWVVLSPFLRRPWIRTMSGVAGVGLFALLTRWEPSVVRAAAMAGLVLTGRLAGMPLDGWSALALATGGSLLVAPRLGLEVGFQLSVAATAGLLAWTGTAGGVVRRALASSLAAQAAVAPILLTAFGSVPLLSPLANLVAAPLVVAATLLGALGVLAGFPPLLVLAELAAGLVLAVARAAAPWPAAGWLGASLVAAGVLLLRSRPVLMPPLLLAGAVWLAVAVSPLGRAPRPSIVFLDVGQGDAALVLGSEMTVLVDGGPDPVVLSRKLADFGLRRLDLVVATHVHADHLEGLDAVWGRVPVGAVWQAFGSHETEASADLLESVGEAGIPVAVPPVGTRVEAGDVVIEVLGPLRGYASPNDESIVLLVHLAGMSVLLPGDIETYAQGDLGPLPADVMKVPHQGAATSDLGWIGASVPRVAVVSVGPNDYGHPSDGVLEALEQAGAEVRRTDLEGDVLLRP